MLLVHQAHHTRLTPLSTTIQNSKQGGKVALFFWLSFADLSKHKNQLAWLFLNENGKDSRCLETDSYYYESEIVSPFC
jgi:hypothetical protein